MSSAKRTSTHLKHGDYEPSSSKQKKFKANLEVQNALTKYNAEGLTRSLHGNVYQLKLLMLFLWRGVCKKYNFDLATEMVEAEKFDDIVFAYKDEKTGEKVYRFLQVKHKQDERKTITANDLLTENDDEFSLQKYFISFRKIKQNSKFVGYKLKDFIICTNIDLHDDLRNSFIPIVDELGDAEANNTDEPHTIDKSNIGEDILSFAFTEKECKRLKLNLSSFPQKDRLLMTLRKTTDCFRLAKKLATCVKEGKKLDLRGDHDLFKVYHVALGENVIERERNKNGKEVDSCVFKSSFLNADSSVPDLDGFKKVFHQAYEEVTKEKLSSHAFLEKLKKQKMPLSSTFGKSKDTKLKTSLPNDYAVTASEINSFLDKLVFAVNQPNETELGKIIKNEMGQYKDINLIDCEFMVSKLQKEMLDWMKQKEGSSFTYQQGKNLFEEIKQNISKLVVIGPTIEYCDKIEAFGIKFCKPLIELEAFLESKTEQVFNLISEHNNITLSSMKVYQTLKENSKYERGDSYIFMRLSSLLRKGMQNHIISASQSIESNNLLVMECEATPDAILASFKKLCRIIELNIEMKRKVIFITERNDEMLERMKTIFSWDSSLIKEKSDDECTLVNLTEDSQKQILQEGQVIFQGEHFSLNKLANNGNKCLLEKINGELLLMLINKEKICIGKAAKDWKYDNVEPFCIDRKLIRPIIKIKNDIAKQNRLFYVTENEVNAEEILQSNLDIVIISDSDDAFKKTCDYEGGNIHWLKKSKHEFEWKKTRGNLSKLREFVIKSTQSIEKYYKELVRRENLKLSTFKFEHKQEPTIEEIAPKKITDIDDKVVLIVAEPGMGKSIILSHLAVNTQSISLPIWIARGNLSDHVNKFNKWERDGTKVSVKEAVIFLCEILQFQLFKNFRNQEIEKKENIMNEMVTILNNQVIFNFLATSKNDEVVFKTNERRRIRGSSLLYMNGTAMLEIEMFTHFYNQGRIAILLDGFDEISPTYKNKGLELLLQALKLTNIDKIWVTTRPYNIKDDIENNLGTFSYSLKPFFKEEQGKFLKKFWGKNLNIGELDEQRTSIFIDNLLNQFSTSVNDRKKNFVGIPLQMYMIAEIFMSDFENFHFSNRSNANKLNNIALDGKLDLIYLYESFLKKKFETAHPELVCKKFNVPTLNDGGENLYQKQLKIFNENHKLLAVYALLRDLLSIEEIDKIKRFIPMIEEGKEKTGIVNKIINGAPDFVHRTFAEYLSADYIWQKFQMIEVDKLEKDFIQSIVIKKMIKNDMVRISKFFQSIVVKRLDTEDNISVNVDKLRILSVNLINLLNDVHNRDVLKDMYKADEIKPKCQSTRLILEVLELSTKLDGSTLELFVDKIINYDERYRLLCHYAQFGGEKLVKSLAKKLETKFLEQYLLNGNWESDPLWLATMYDHLDNTQILVEKYSRCIKPLMDVTGKTLYQFHSGIVISIQCVKYGLIDCKPYVNDGKVRLPLLEALKHHASLDAIRLIAEKSDFDIVNNFQYCQETNDVYFTSLCFASEYDEEIAENAVKNGMDFSKAIYLLLYKYTKYNLRNHLSKYRTWPGFRFMREYVHFMITFFGMKLLYIHKKIESLLKCGTGYNYRDNKYKLTTLQMLKQIHNVHLLLNAMYELCKFENENPLDILLSIIIESIAKTPNFKGYKIIIQSTQISLLPIYKKDSLSFISSDSLEYTKKIHLPPNYMAKLLFESYTKNNKEIIGKKLAQLGPAAIDIKKFRVFISKSNLVQRLQLLIEKQGYSADDAIAEINVEISKSEKFLTRLKSINNASLQNVEKMYQLDEILGLLNITSLHRDKFQKFTSKFDDFGSIQIPLLIKIWLDLKNYVGQKKVMGLLEEMVTFSWQSSGILKFFSKLDDSYKALTNAIENGKHQDIIETLQQNSDFVKSIINSQDDKIGSPLHYAVYQGDMKTIEMLLTYGANPNLRLNGEHSSLKNGNYDNWPPLHLACVCGHTDAVKRLLTAGSKIDAIIYSKTIHEGETALHASARSSANHSKIAELLLQHGAKYDLENALGQTPLNLAKHGSDIGELLDWIDQIFKNVENNNEDVAVSLLSINNNDKMKTILNAKNNDALTLMQVADANEKSNVVRILIEKLRSVDMNNPSQKTALVDEASFHKTSCICKMEGIKHDQEGIMKNCIENMDKTFTQRLKKTCAALSHTLSIPLNHQQQETVLANMASFYKISPEDEIHRITESILFRAWKGSIRNPTKQLIRKLLRMKVTDEVEESEAEPPPGILYDSSSCINVISEFISNSFSLPARARYKFDLTTQ